MKQVLRSFPVDMVLQTGMIKQKNFQIHKEWVELNIEQLVWKVSTKYTYLQLEVSLPIPGFHPLLLVMGTWKIVIFYMILHLAENILYVKMLLCNSTAHRIS